MVVHTKHPCRFRSFGARHVLLSGNVRHVDFLTNEERSA
jgi:hypothetical protein